MTWLPDDRLTLFAGVHRGFSPPRTEDILDNSGQTVDIDTESSWNYELGVRARLGEAGAFEATYFRMDFSNQVVPSSVAGGAGAALTSAGATRHAGLEFAVNVNLSPIARTRTPIDLGATYTYLATARYHSPRFVFVGSTASDGIGRIFVGQNAAQTRDRVPVTGNRLPYAATHLASAWGSIEPRGGTRVRGDVIITSAMFADPLNTTVLSPDGQQGPRPIDNLEPRPLAGDPGDRSGTLGGDQESLRPALRRRPKPRTPAGTGADRDSWRLPGVLAGSTSRLGEVRMNR